MGLKGPGTVVVVLVACGLPAGKSELSSGPKFEWEIDEMEGPIISENDGCKEL